MVMGQISTSHHSGKVLHTAKCRFWFKKFLAVMLSHLRSCLLFYKMTLIFSRLLSDCSGIQGVANCSHKAWSGAVAGSDCDWVVMCDGSDLTSSRVTPVQLRSVHCPLQYPLSVSR